MTRLLRAHAAKAAVLLVVAATYALARPEEVDVGVAPEGQDDHRDGVLEHHELRHLRELPADVVEQFGKRIGGHRWLLVG